MTAELVSKGFDTARENEREFGERKSGVAFSKVGKNADRRSIYKTNYPLNTPKNIKRQDIIDIVQNVWSKKPISLTVIENSIKKEITARFNPEISERSDLSKIAFGNRKGSASEQRMTLDLSSDLYAIAEEAKFTKSKEEIGKLNNPAHDDVTLWHYFITNMIYRDSNDNDIECHMNIDVKKNKDGYWFYSFAIEKGTAPQTLLAAVTDKKSATVPNDNIPRSFEKSNPSIQKNSDSGKYSKDDTIHSDNFKDWFGDWQNHPESASKVVDKDGKPLVVYHGTGSDFNVFDKNRIGQHFGESRGDTLGFYFTPYESEAKGYAKEAAYDTGQERVVGAYLSLKNPLIVEDSGWGSAIEQADIRHRDLMRWAKAGNHDGIIVVSTDEEMEDGSFDTVYIAFEPTQIKSATDNIGTFDKQNPDIRYSKDDTIYDWLRDEYDGDGNVDISAMTRRNPVKAVEMIYGHL